MIDIRVGEFAADMIKSFIHHYKFHFVVQANVKERSVCSCDVTDNKSTN